MASFPCSPTVTRGHSGGGIDIDASGLMRLSVQAETYAKAGDRLGYETALELLAERLEAMSGFAAAIRAELAVKS